MAEYLVGGVVAFVDAAFADVAFVDAAVASVVDSINGGFADNMDFGKDWAYSHHHILVPTFLALPKEEQKVASSFLDAVVDAVEGDIVNSAMDAAVVELERVYYQIQWL